MNKHEPPIHLSFRCIKQPLNPLWKEDMAKAIVKAALIKLKIIGE